MQEMKDMMLKQNETVLYTEPARAEGQRGEIESTLQHVSFHDGVQRDEETEQSRQELVQEIRQKQASTRHFGRYVRKYCQERFMTVRGRR